MITVWSVQSVLQKCTCSAGVILLNYLSTSKKCKVTSFCHTQTPIIYSTKYFIFRTCYPNEWDFGILFVSSGNFHSASYKNTRVIKYSWIYSVTVWHSLDFDSLECFSLRYIPTFVIYLSPSGFTMWSGHHIRQSTPIWHANRIKKKSVLEFFSIIITSWILFLASAIHDWNNVIYQYLRIASLGKRRKDFGDS